MPQFKRRHFLQSTGSLLAALGLSQLDIMRQGDEYAKVLAQSTRRKLALLVGINEYSNRDINPLRGCVNDVDLQQQLLINKFGFHPKNIVSLTDAKATRSGILAAFEEHLIKQAKPGDVVVFHFSGHGSQVLDPDSITSDGLNSTFVTHDSLRSHTPNNNVVNDIMGRTLFLLTYALQTENVTVVLDSCHAGGGTRGNFVVRATDQQLQASPEELEYQLQWLSRLKMNPQEFKARRKAGIAKGVAIAGAKRDQQAADARFDDICAGAFTYAMTQYLWQQTKSEPLGTAMVNVARTTQQNARSYGIHQDLQFEVKPNSDNDKRPVYLIGQQMPPAEAVIVGVDGDRPQIWLGGVNAENLKAFGKGTVLKVIDSKGKQQGLLELETRNGLKAQGKLQGTAKPGNLLQEQIRGIPNDVTLTIGLDPSLGNDTNTARSALQAIKKIEAIPLLQKEVQYIFGRMTDAYRRDFQKQKVANIPPVGKIGLFTPSLEIIPNSFDGPPGESVSEAITRLQPKFQSLLAARFLKLSLNINSSRLNVTASMTRQDDKKVVASIFTVRGGLGKGTTDDKPPTTLPADASKLPLGTRVQFQVSNKENRDLYVGIFVIDATGEMSAIFPNNWTDSGDVTRVKAGQTLLVPDPNDSNFALVAQEPKGMSEVLIIASSNPMKNGLQGLRDMASRSGTSRGPITPDKPVEVVNNLLDDLSEVTDKSKGISKNENSEVKKMNTSQMAAMSITFEVI